MILRWKSKKLKKAASLTTQLPLKRFSKQQEMPQKEFEVEKIIQARPSSTAGAGMEYYVKWKGFSGDGSHTWEPEYHLTNAMQMLKEFKERHRRMEVIPLQAAGAPGSRRQRQHNALPPEQAAAPKRRHTSASSVDVTPEYRDVRSQQQQRPSPLEKQLSAKRRRREKLHNSSKEIAAASLQRRERSDPRAPGPSGRVSTRKCQQRGADAAPATLAEVLTRPPPPLVKVSEALSRFGWHQPPATGVDSVDARTLRRLVSAGDPDRLSAVLRRATCPELDAPLPPDSDDDDDARSQRRLVHLAAEAGQPAAELLLLLLLAAGASPHAADAEGRTALMLAAGAGKERAVGRLLQFGARPDQQDSGRRSALAFAVAGRHWDAAAVLLRHGAEFASLARQFAWFNPAQLRPWTDRVSEPLLRILHRLCATNGFLRDRSVHLVAARPPYLSSLAPGALRAFTFARRAAPLSQQAGGSAHLLVVAAVELDGLGGVALRRVPGAGPMLARLTLNDRTLAPLASQDGLGVYPLDDCAGEGPDGRSKLRVYLHADCPAAGCRLKLVAQVVRLLAPG